MRYDGVDASKWAQAQETIGSEYGISVDSERGEQSKSGFTLKWIYDSAAQTLEIQCLDKPFLIPCGVVNNRIAALADQCGMTPVR